jgi:hypothetical protein
LKPVLYLDIDDTLLSWASGEPRAVPGAGRFVTRALERFEVRWLSRWCPDGRMPERLLLDLAKMLGIAPACLRAIRGCIWDENGIKVDGITWLEHVALDREFLWIENRDGLTPRDLEVLREAARSDCYIACDVTEDEAALDRVLPLLDRRLS